VVVLATASHFHQWRAASQGQAFSACGTSSTNITRGILIGAALRIVDRVARDRIDSATA
jgi:hypothetical protein